MTVGTAGLYKRLGELTRGESLSIEESIDNLGTCWTRIKCLKKKRFSDNRCLCLSTMISLIKYNSYIIAHYWALKVTLAVVLTVKDMKQIVPLLEIYLTKLAIWWIIERN